MPDWSLPEGSSPVLPGAGVLSTRGAWIAEMSLCNRKEASANICETKYFTGNLKIERITLRMSTRQSFIANISREDSREISI